MYQRRQAEKTLKEYLNSFCIIGITGPRQSGKTTLLKHSLTEYRYVSMDDFQISEFFRQDPVAFMNKYNDKVIFDEVHYTPELLHHLKNHVDNDRSNYGKFVITSSSQFTYLQKITESLAGRIGLMSLLPLEYSELPNEFSDQIIIRGSYPELVLNPLINSNHWFSSYLETYLDKDVRQISNIGNMGHFRRLISLLALQAGQILDLQKLSNEIGVSSPTIKHWISILEASYIIFLLKPYHNNFGKRITKRPKIYFFDTGLICFLTGITSTLHFNNGPMGGAIFENYIIAELHKRYLHAKNYSSFYYLRTNNQDEIDLIIDHNHSLELIEIKKNASFTPKMLKHIKKYISDKDQGTVIYQGSYFSYSDNISAINFQEYLSTPL